MNVGGSTPLAISTGIGLIGCPAVPLWSAIGVIVAGLSGGVTVYLKVWVTSLPSLPTALMVTTEGSPLGLAVVGVPVICLVAGSKDSPSGSPLTVRVPGLMFSALTVIGVIASPAFELLSPGLVMLPAGGAGASFTLNGAFAVLVPPLLGYVSFTGRL